MKEARKVYLALAILLTAALLAGCKSVPGKTEDTSQMPPVVEVPATDGAEGTKSSSPSSHGDIEGGGKERLVLLFAGDIMAHNVNYRMKDYSAIWAGIKDVVSSSDAAFANIEMPVDDDLPLSSYPQFNVHTPYVEAAIDAGFNVFSLVNNHTNDQGLDGMEATREWADKRQSESAASARPLYFSGLKSGDALSYAVIDVRGYRLLFLAVTEILNRGDYKRYMNYIGMDEAARQAFIEEIKALRRDNPCDIFVLSIHANVTEYVHEISAVRREWYSKLLSSGVDVLWGNHPHIVQDVDIDGNKIVMFACGNVISGQRSSPQFAAPRTERDATGDGLMMKVVFTASEEGTKIEEAVPYFITTYITPKGEYVVNMNDDAFIETLKKGGRTTWASYLQARRRIMEEVKIDTICGQETKYSKIDARDGA